MATQTRLEASPTDRFARSAHQKTPINISPASTSIGAAHEAGNPHQPVADGRKTGQ